MEERHSGLVLGFLEKRREKKIISEFMKLEEKQKIAVVLSCFDSELMNGGLCQFFINDTRLYAPYVAGYLNIVGAKEISSRFTNFVESNGIDLNNLSSFKCRSLEEFSAQYKRYPFDDFDNFYYEQNEVCSVLSLSEKYLLGE